MGSFELKTLRDRAGNDEPHIVQKYQTQLTDELERKVLTPFALGNSYQGIRSHITDIDGMSFSNSTINVITDKLLPELQAYLEAAYPMIWLNAIHYKMKENGRYISKTIYDGGFEH